MVSNQAYLFFIFIVNGILIGLLFDFFRIARKVFRTNDIITYIQDILFWILTEKELAEMLWKGEFKI